MQDKPIHITVQVEELHIHHPDSEDGPVSIGLSDVADVEFELQEESVSNHVGGKQGPQPSYDVRDKPIRGLILKELSESDGATISALAEILDANYTTVSNALNQYREQYNAVVKLKEADKTYYQITDVGETMLEEYKNRWRQGYKRLPEGYLEGLNVQ